MSNENSDKLGLANLKLNLAGLQAPSKPFMQLAGGTGGSKTYREQVNSSNNLTRDVMMVNQSPQIDSFFRIEKPSGRKLTFDEN